MKLLGTDPTQRRRLLLLLVPMMAEQCANVFVGFINTAMVSGVSERALSAISLVDTITLLLMQLFVAIGSGGAIVAAQFLGHQDYPGARRAANVTALMALGCGLTVGLLTCLFSRPMLRVIYPTLDGVTRAYCVQYLVWTAASFPLMALHSAGTGMLYAEGNSRSAMYATLTLNAVKVAANVLLIDVMKLEVVGAGAATLASRLAGAAMVTALLLNRSLPLHYERPFFRFHARTCRLILRVAVPSGMELSLFLLAKLIIGTVIARFPSPMIAANAAANTLSTLLSIPSSALSTAAVPIVGQAVGAGMPEQARSSAKKLLALRYMASCIISVVLFVLLEPVTRLLSLGEEAFRITQSIMRLYCVLAVVLEPLAFGLAYFLRAAGDTKHTMVVSIASAFLARVVFSYLFVYAFNMGIHGIWLAMYVDWVVRGALFIRRFRGDRWLTKAVV